MTLTAQPLLSLAQQLGIDRDHLAGNERVDRILGTFSADAAAIANLTEEALVAFVRAYGQGAQVEIGTGELPQLSVSGSVPSEDLARLREDAGAAVGARYDVVIDIDKAPLREALLGGDAQAVGGLFFFGSALQRLLRRGPRAIEHEVWAETAQRLVLMVLDIDVLVRGPFMSLVGGDQLASAADEASLPAPPDLSRVAARRAEYIGWDASIETSLTPQHLAHSPAPEAAGLVASIDALLVGLSLLYTCDRARVVELAGEPPFIQAQYRGSEYSAYVPFRWADELPVLQPEQLAAVSDVVDWVYETAPNDAFADAAAERLTFIQTRAAQLLEGRDERDRFAGFALAAPNLAESMKWHWRAFVERRVNEYLQQVRDLETIVAGTVTRLADQTAGLVKRLTDTSLAAVAALIGSFVAATFRDPFNAELFRVGMLAYAAYVVLFPLLVGVASTIGDARVAISSFKTERVSIDAVLGRDRVDELVGSRTLKARRRFRLWAAIVSVAYLIAASSAALAAYVVPELLEKPAAQEES